MFTGIIQDCGKVSEIRPLPDGGAALLIHAPHTASHTHTGHSIAVLSLIHISEPTRH